MPRETRRSPTAHRTAARAPPPVDAPIHGDERVDDWYWLRDRDDPAVLAYLEAENAYADAVLAPPGAALRDRIFAEIRGTRAGDRRVGAGPRRRVGVLLPHRRRPAVRDPLPAPAAPGSRPRGVAGSRRARSCSSTRTCSPADTTTSRSAASRSRPTTTASRTRPTSPAASATRCASATSTTGDRPRRRRRRRHLRPRVGRRRAHVLLRAARRRDAPERGVAPRARHARRRRRRSCSARTTSASSSTSTAHAPAASC